MRRYLTLLSAFLLLLSTMALPALATPHEGNPGGNCNDGFVKLEVVDTPDDDDTTISVGETITIKDVPGDDGENYTVIVTLEDPKKLTFVVLDSEEEEVDDALVDFCVKGGPGNTGNITNTGFDNADAEPPLLNDGNQRANISNFVIYGVIIPDDDTGLEEEPEVCYAGETAWADGDRYVRRGNWATYTAYQSDEAVTIFAGQTIEVGTAEFSDAIDGEVTITITLSEGVRLAVDPETGEALEEAVKIQGYNAAPSGNPAPGLFTTYKGNSLVITVPEFDYYGIHLDVEVEVECPENEEDGGDDETTGTD